jgi:hypothetical protein
MPEQPSHPQVNMSRLAVGGNIGGMIFAMGCMLIVLIGIPAIRYVFPVAVAVGLVIALVLHLIHPTAPGKDWIGPLSDRKL